jgi:DNA gyrase/topoisomerase IV subunit A
LEHERSVLIKELRRLTALSAALDVIEKVIKIIREAKNDEDARTKL